MPSATKPYKWLISCLMDTHLNWVRSDSAHLSCFSGLKLLVCASMCHECTSLWYVSLNHLFWQRKNDFVCAWVCKRVCECASRYVYVYTYGPVCVCMWACVCMRVWVLGRRLLYRTIYVTIYTFHTVYTLTYVQARNAPVCTNWFITAFSALTLICDAASTQGKYKHIYTTHQALSQHTRTYMSLSIVDSALWHWSATRPFTQGKYKHIYTPHIKHSLTRTYVHTWAYPSQHSALRHWSATRPLLKVNIRKTKKNASHIKHSRTCVSLPSQRSALWHWFATRSCINTHLHI